MTSRMSEMGLTFKRAAALGITLDPVLVLVPMTALQSSTLVVATC